MILNPKEFKIEFVWKFTEIKYFVDIQYITQHLVKHVRATNATGFN